IEAERRAHRNGGELMIYLDGVGPAMREVMERLEYRVSPETYDLLLWPKSLLTSGPATADLANWRFSFADHDAF
ncbi:MAG: hypothetical protein L0Y42_15270, partial [Phycisphaerales bacterium]|nr:hypothetical protein [Phycisphaerales bacterium]